MGLKNWRQYFRDPMDRALLAYCEKITFIPHLLTSGDLQHLQAAGYSAKQALDIVLVAAYRHYIVRVADSTGIRVEQERVEKSILKQYSYSGEGPARAAAEIGELPGSGVTLAEVVWNPS